MSNKSCGFRGKHVFERMNFLHQASEIILNSDKVAASFYGNAIINCAKKAVLKIEPDLKRNICKGCQCPLIPGEIARVRLITRPSKAIRITCLLCKTSKKIINKKNFKLWLECPDSTVRILTDPVPSKKESDSK